MSLRTQSVETTGTVPHYSVGGAPTGGSSCTMASMADWLAIILHFVVIVVIPQYCIGLAFSYWGDVQVSLPVRLGLASLIPIFCFRRPGRAEFIMWVKHCIFITAIMTACFTISAFFRPARR